MAGIFDADKAGMLPIADVGDAIFFIESSVNPFMRLIKTGRTPTQMIHSWPGQVREDRAFEGVLDGVDKVDGYGHSLTTPLQNCLMKLVSPGWLVSDFAQITVRAGVKDEVKKQMGDDAFDFARMVERQVMSASAARIQDKGKPYQSGGLLWWANSAATVSDAENTYLTVPEQFRPLAAQRHTGALSALTATAFEAMLRVTAERQNAPVDLTFFAGSALKRLMSLWMQRDTSATPGTATAIYSLNAKEKRLAQAVEFFEFDSGSVRTIQTFNLACDPATGAKTNYSTRSGVGVDMSLVEMCYGRKIKAWVDNLKSGGPRGHHDAIYTLRNNMPANQISVYSSAD
jgi:hypothetical protein